MSDLAYDAYSEQQRERCLEANIMNADFEGMKHKAITYCYEEEDTMAKISKKLAKGKN